jgi:hypothetical protein
VAGQHGVEQLGVLGDVAVVQELLAHPLVSGSPEALTERRLGEQAPHGQREGVQVGGVPRSSGPYL